MDAQRPSASPSVERHRPRRLRLPSPGWTVTQPSDPGRDGAQAPAPAPPPRFGQDMRPQRTISDDSVGVGWRVPHYRYVIEQHPPVDYFEIISENFMRPGGKPLYYLERLLDHYPVVAHGVSLNLGGPQQPERGYLEALKHLVRRIRPQWVSDHACWCAAQGAHSHDLLPLPYTREAVERVAKRAQMVQDYLEVPLALENPSSYLLFGSNEMTEWQFLSEIAERADCGLLLDVNNVYVTSTNHRLDPQAFIRNIPHERVVQIHLAGHTDLGNYLLDTHHGEIAAPVWQLYRELLQRTGPRPTLIEWDEDVPEFPRLQQLVEHTKAHAASALAPGGAA